jgi:hypothetical protein
MFGPAPRGVTDQEYRRLPESVKSARFGHALYTQAFLKNGPDSLVFVEVRVLYNVHRDLTGDLSLLWGDASGIHGRVNFGTSGNVTGLVGSMNNIFGDVSGVWGPINPRLFGTLSEIGGDLTGKFGYCSDVCGDVSGIRGNLTRLVGCATGITATVASMEMYPWVLADSSLHFVHRELRNFRRDLCHGDWSMCWGDASWVLGSNDGLFGDVSGASGDVTGRRCDTAFRRPETSGREIIQAVIPLEGETGEIQSAVRPTEEDAPVSSPARLPLPVRRAEADWNSDAAFGPEDVGSGIRRRPSFLELELDLRDLAAAQAGEAA